MSSYEPDEKTTSSSTDTEEVRNPEFEEFGEFEILDSKGVSDSEYMPSCTTTLNSLGETLKEVAPKDTKEIRDLITLYPQQPNNTLLLIELISCCNAYPVPTSFLFGQRKIIANAISQIRLTAIEMVRASITSGSSTATADSSTSSSAAATAAAATAAAAAPRLFPPHNTSSDPKTTEQKLNEFIKEHLFTPLVKGKPLPVIVSRFNDYDKFKLWFLSRISPCCILFDTEFISSILKPGPDRLQYIRQLKDEGFTAVELRKAGFSLKQLIEADFDAMDLRVAGFSARELEMGDFTDDEILHAGFSASQLREAGFAASELRVAGFSPRQLTEAGFSLEQLKKAGFSARDLKEAYFSASQLREAGFSLRQLIEAGFAASELRVAGFSPRELRDATNENGERIFTDDEILHAGFSASQLKDAGFSPRQLKNADFTAGDLRMADFSPRQLRLAGFFACDLKEAGFSASQLREAGFSLWKLIVAGFSPRQLTEAGFSLEQLREAGFDTRDLKEAGFSLRELIAVGFDAWQLRRAGFSARALREATDEKGNRSFSDDQILHADFSAQKLLDAGFSPWDILSSNLPVNNLEFSLIKDPDSDFPPTSTATSSAPICTVCTAEHTNHRHRSDRILILDFLLREIMKNDSSLWPQKLMDTNCENNIVDRDTAQILVDALYKIQNAKSIEDLQNAETLLNVLFSNAPLPIIQVPAQTLYGWLNTIRGINLQGQVADSVATFRGDSFLSKIASAIVRTNAPLQPIGIDQIVPLIRERISDPGIDAHVQADIERILAPHIEDIVNALIVPPNALMPDLIPAIMRLLPQRKRAQYFRMPISMLFINKKRDLLKQRREEQCLDLLDALNTAYKNDDGKTLANIQKAFIATQNGESATYKNAQGEITPMPLLTSHMQKLLQDFFHSPFNYFVTSEQKYNKFIGEIHQDAVTERQDDLPVAFDPEMLPRAYFQFPLDDKNSILKLLNGKIGNDPFHIGACTPLRQPTLGVLNFNEAIRTNNIIVVLKNTTKNPNTATIQDIDHILFPYQFIKLFGIRIPELFSKKEIPVLFYPNRSSE